MLIVSLYRPTLPSISNTIFSMVPPNPVKTFAVLLGENEGRAGYASGESVCGHLLLDLVAPLSFKALRLQAHGGARINWGESGHGAWREEEVQYLELTHTLKEADAESVVTLPAGKHKFPFRVQLPHSPLKTSFSGKYGNIKYYLVAFVDQPSAPVPSTRREFQVIRHIDVNSPSLLSPVSRSKDKMVGWSFFASGPVSLSAKIERKGYCNGEAIPIYAEFENCSSRLIIPKAAIFQTQTYRSNGKTKTYRRMLANVRGNHVASGSADSWNGKTLKIPPVSPSILGCGPVQVEYTLAVYIHIPGAKKLMIELPLVIGTIPFNGFASCNTSITSQLSMDMSWLTMALPEAPEAPPNYADVVSEEEFSMHVPPHPQTNDVSERELLFPMFALMQEFRFQPPPVYSEIDPYPIGTEAQHQTVSFII